MVSGFSGAGVGAGVQVAAGTGVDVSVIAAVGGGSDVGVDEGAQFARTPATIMATPKMRMNLNKSYLSRFSLVGMARGSITVNTLPRPT